jgi:hypothetical protein
MARANYDGVFYLFTQTLSGLRYWSRHAFLLLCVAASVEKHVHISDNVHEFSECSYNFIQCAFWSVNPQFASTILYLSPPFRSFDGATLGLCEDHVRVDGWSFLILWRFCPFAYPGCFLSQIFVILLRTPNISHKRRFRIFDLCPVYHLCRGQ